MDTIRNLHLYRRWKSLARRVIPLVFAAICVGCRSPKTGTYSQELAKAKQAGIPVSAQDLQQPLPPPEQNAGPLYVQLTARLKASPLIKEEYAILARKMPSEAQWASARSAFQHRSEQLALIHKAVARPKCVYVHDWSNPAAVQFPELPAMRQSIRLLMVDSLLLAHSGKPLEAVRNQALGFQIARHAASGDFLISYLTAVAVDAITLAGLQKLLYLAGSDPTVADAVRAAVEKGWTPHSLAYALRREAGTNIVELEYLRRQGPSSLNEVLGDPAAGRLHMSAKEWNAFLDVNGSVLLQDMREMIAAADRPYPQAALVLHAVDTRVNQDKDRRHLLLLVFFPVYANIAETQAHLQAQVEVMRSAAAVLAWKDRNGAFPATLESALSPAPVDPFDGKPLRYRREGTSFIVYSVGKDGKFTGGTPDKKPEASEVVFRYPLPPYYQYPAPAGH